ncbi:hypothetical protein M1437_04835 [Patescibacteria group bacterium]|nr:hypothetical protein [Patescibacteria group bacterium]
MGFIERLEQQRETEAQVRSQREAREQELHQQRSQQAVNYLQESNVENLLIRLASVVKGRVGMMLIAVSILKETLIVRWS